MDRIRDELLEKSTEYFQAFPDLKGESPSPFLVDFVIEKYIQHRNFPSNFTDEKIKADMRNHLSTMAMAVVDIFLKAGAEGEINHSENSVSRTYENAYISASVFNDVLPYVRVISHSR